MKREKSVQIALGGIFSSFCLLMMFLSSVVPFSSFAMPMLAGAALSVVVIENGCKTAFLVYISVSLLSVFMVPDLDTKLMFIAFFGYYGIFKHLVEKLRPRLLRGAIKLLIYNAAMIICYYLSIKILGTDAAAESEFFRKYGVPVLFLGMNVTFIIYDYALTRYLRIYMYWFSPTFLRK